MRRAKAANNAKHEAGHWITGWILERASQGLVIATHDVGDSYCERVPHPDFLNLSQINCHLGNRIINLLGGAKAESLVCGNFNNQIFNDLVNNYQGAWPDFLLPLSYSDTTTDHSILQSAYRLPKNGNHLLIELRH